MRPHLFTVTQALIDLEYYGEYVQSRKVRLPTRLVLLSGFKRTQQDQALVVEDSAPFLHLRWRMGKYC